MKKIIIGLISILPLISFASGQTGDINLNVTTTSGCLISANNIHFDLSQNQAIKNTNWHANKQRVFDLDKFLTVNMQCSKGVSFYLAGDSNSSEQNSLVYHLSHNQDVDAPKLTYWLNNWSTSGYASMYSTNITKLQNTASRLANKANNLYYKVNDGNPAWIKFAAQIEADSIYSFKSGDYSDTITLILTY